ncbi:ABC transporter permease [Gordoniibacillus kamchatkensis]|uniref:ABC transporter permease n=1 Tax=Gordoniibacillus kamchatkensis TaxID=1590651 RepID=A0ABR5AIM3_9BACL|nr:ABC transporter permease [Paenibacillus sp. VKM B-2647]KIL40790.1 ABC transporter permease [Paenibacillus sp. VKM B-2647]
MNQADIIQAPGDALIGEAKKDAATSAAHKKAYRSELRENGKGKAALRGALFPLVLLAVWQLCGSFGLISATLLPTPADIAKTFYELLISGDLFRHLGVSMGRAALGFVLGGAAGLLMGLGVGLFRRLEQTVDPSIQMLRTVPHLAITPLFILWFGFGEFSKILLIALGAFFPLYIQTFQGIRSVDAKLFDVARVLEFSRSKQVTKLVLPAALPHILLGLRLSLGVAWLGLVVAELMGSSEGIGYLIMDARQFAQTATVFVGIAIFAVVGKATDSLVRHLEKKLLRWRESFSG